MKVNENILEKKTDKLLLSTMAAKAVELNSKL